MVRDLRIFLYELERKYSKKILKIRREVSCKYEVTAIQKKLTDMGMSPVLFFENPITVQGQKSGFKLVTNLFADYSFCAEILGIPHNEVVADSFLQRMSRKIDPEIVSSKEAPVKQVIEKDDINLYKFPIVVHYEKDAGPYITAGFVTTYDPDTGINNTSIQRLWVKAKDRLGYFAIKGSHNWRNIQKFWELGMDAPVAIWIGHHPSIIIGAQAKLRYPESHYSAASSIIGEPLRLVPTEMFKDRLFVPADAEIVIEGIIPKNKLEEEGPFGEYPGYYSGKTLSPVIEPKSITYRKDAIYHDIGPALPDHLIVDVFALEAKIYKTVKTVVPELINVHVPISGCSRFHAYLQVRKTRPGVGKQAILAALTSDIRLKHVFVFDEDINIFDEREVLWAIATRSQWDKDMIIIPNMPSDGLDPSIQPPRVVGCKGGIDCTKPLPEEFGGHEFPARIKVPDDVWAKIKLEEYIEK
ncbi:MAG: UbiD family decarboxylase [Desulfurococcaceae archaeon]